MTSLPNPEQTTGRNVRLLIVEDESVVAMDLEERLGRMGYNVCGIADNAADAVVFARRTKPELALMDIHLKGKIDGIQAAAELRKTTDIPVVFITAHADDSTLRRAGLTEPYGYVVKPFDERELRATIEVAICRRQAEDRLRKMERWLASTLGSIGEGVIATDAERRITFINGMAEAITGWSRREAIGGLVEEVFVVSASGAPNESVRLVQQALHEGESNAFGEGRLLQTRNGRLIQVEDSIAPIREDDGHITGCVVVFRDASKRRESEEERRRLQEGMREAQRLESLGVLARGIAHDFNNLLVTVTCNASLAAEMLAPNSAVQPLLADIEKAGERAAELCSQMLAYSGENRTALRDVALSPFVRDTLRLLRTAIARDAELVIDLSEELPAVRADRSQLQQVLMNLVINAGEALNGLPGKITVRTNWFHAEKPFLAACRTGSHLPEDRYLLLEVNDTGHGMSQETLARLFEPFFTTKSTGRGLGLASMLGIVSGHGGALAVESAEGKGTTFRILLRPADRPAPIVAEGPVDLTWTSSGPALIVDDEAPIRTATGAALTRLGFAVDFAEDGHFGIEKVHAANGDYRVVFLDLTMPKLDGHATFDILRTAYPNLPIVMMSGYSSKAAAPLLDRGPTRFISKPFTTRRLIEILAPLLAQSGAAKA
ncbi:MAG TPA: response regulator [Chthoniobacteraceae bacterium]|jgi:PAS domain S-box-containing protein